MVSLWIVLGILAVHWFANFVLQTDYQAKNKGRSWDALLSYTLTYMIVWAVPAMWVMGVRDGVIFCMITFVAHTITDYFTSKLSSKLRREGREYSLYMSIGFDQLLHYIQLLLTYYYLTI